MSKALKAKVLGIASAVAIPLAGLGVAQAQSFGGLPTITPQAQAARERAAAAAKAQAAVKRELPGYVVVDKNGVRETRGNHVYTKIQDAVDNVAWGGVVVVLPGVYEENVTLSRSVSLQGDRGNGQGVVIQPPRESTEPCLKFEPIQLNDHALISNITFAPGNRLQPPQPKKDEDKALAEATMTEGDYSKYAYGFTNSTDAAIANASSVTPCIDVKRGVFTMIESVVDGGGMHRGDLIRISGGTALLEKNKVTGGRRGIAVDQNHELWHRTMLVDNIISDNLVEGVHLAGVSNVLATGNLINANRGRGLVYNGRGAATLVGNKILNNASHGVLLDRDARQVLVRLNQIWANKGDGIKVRSSGGLIEDNDIDGNEGLEISTIGHLDTIPTIINDVKANEKSPKRGGWSVGTGWSNDRRR